VFTTSGTYLCSFVTDKLRRISSWLCI